MNVLKKILVLTLRRMGYSNYFASHILEERYRDLFHNKSTTIKEKVWAQKRGFLSDKISIYGLTEDNYRNYLSDFDYWKMHPINGQFGHWIDDKLTMKLILHPFSEYLPEYYYHIGNGEILRLMDCPDQNGNSIEGVIWLLNERQFLAAKLFSGSIAEGFYKLSYEENCYFINNKMLSMNDLQNLLSQWKNIKAGGYLITEYIHANSVLGKIWNKAPNTLRVLVIRENYAEAKLAGAFFRFGTSKTGVVDNASVGGVACYVDVDTGEFSDGKIIKDYKIIRCPYHPDTNVLLEGELPHWDMLKTTLIGISEYLPQLKYLGYDVIFTNCGFKIIEINSHPGIRLHQFYVPFFKNETTNDFFAGV